MKIFIQREYVRWPLQYRMGDEYLWMADHVFREIDQELNHHGYSPTGRVRVLDPDWDNRFHPDWYSRLTTVLPRNWEIV